MIFKLTFATCCRHLGFLKITSTRTTIRTILLRKIRRFRPRIDKIHPSTAKSFTLFHRRSSPQIFPGKIWNYHVMHILFCDWTVELMAWTGKIVVLFPFFISFFLVFFPHLLLTIFFFSPANFLDRNYKKNGHFSQWMIEILTYCIVSFRKL